jgi:hypothetical protein
VEQLPRTYIYCTRPGRGDVFHQFAQHARSDGGWQFIEVDASHSPHITAPALLANLLHSIPTGRSARDGS